MGPGPEPTLELIVANDPDTLDPRYVVDVVGLRASRLVYAGLTRSDPETLAPIPYLACSWIWRSPTTLAVDLRSDLHWANGTELSSDDVVATFEALRDPAVLARHAYLMDPVERVSSEGSSRVVFQLHAPRAAFLTDLEFPILRRDEASAHPAPGGTLDGLGPYRVEGFAVGEVRLAPRALALFAKHPRLTLRTVRDENARALRLLAGKTDVAENVISPTLVSTLAEKGTMALAKHVGANTTYLVFRVDRPPLSNLELRRRIRASIDRSLITRTLLGGFASPATTFVPPGHWAHTEASATPTPRVTDVLSAPLETPWVILTSTERTRQLVGQFIAQELRDAQIPASSRALELGTLIARLNRGDFDAAILQFPEFVDPTTLRQFLHSNEVPPLGWNRGRVRDAVLDALLERADGETSPERRRELYHQVEERLRDTLVMIPLWHEDNVALVSPRAAFTPTADGRWLGLARILQP